MDRSLPRWQVRVAGLVADAELDPEVREVVTAEFECTTVLRAALPDQAALHGFLHRLNDSGLEIVDVRCLTDLEQGP